MEPQPSPRAIRFPERIWKLIQREAKYEGISASQFVREAALSRVFFNMGKRGDTLDVDAAVQRAREELNRSSPGS